MAMKTLLCKEGEQFSFCNKETPFKVHIGCPRLGAKAYVMWTLGLYFDLNIAASRPQALAAELSSERARQWCQYVR